MPRKKVIQFQVENIEKVPIDVDGDGEPDGSLVTMFVNGKPVSKKFLPFQKLKGIVDKATNLSPQVNSKKQSNRKLFYNKSRK